MITVEKVTSRSASVARGAEARRPRRWPTILCASLGMVLVATVGGVIGFRNDRVECVMLGGPATVTAGEHAVVRFRLINQTGRNVQLRPRYSACWRTRLEGVPEQLRPHERRDIAVALSTSGLNGPLTFSAAISTNATPRLLVAAADVTVNADWLVRRVTLGTLSSGAPAIEHIQIDNVPAGNLVRIGSPSNRHWSARLVSAMGRTVQMDLTIAPPRVDNLNAPLNRTDCEFSLYFSNADVRRVQVIATARVAGDGGSGKSATSTSLRRTQRPRAFTAARSTLGGFQAGIGGS